MFSSEKSECGAWGYPAVKEFVW